MDMYIYIYIYINVKCEEEYYVGLIKSMKRFNSIFLTPYFILYNSVYKDETGGG